MVGAHHSYTGRQPSYRDIWNYTAAKSVPTSFRSILTHYFLYKYIVWSHILIFLLSSMFSSTLLFDCTISVVPVRWLSLSVHKSKCYPMCKFATSQVRWSYHSNSQPAYELPSASWYILPATRCVPAGRCQSPKHSLIHYLSVEWSHLARKSRKGSLNFIIDLSCG